MWDVTRRHRKAYQSSQGSKQSSMQPQSPQRCTRATARQFWQSPQNCALWQCLDSATPDWTPIGILQYCNTHKAAQLTYYVEIMTETGKNVDVRIIRLRHIIKVSIIPFINIKICRKLLLARLTAHHHQKLPERNIFVQAPSIKCSGSAAKLKAWSSRGLALWRMWTWRRYVGEGVVQSSNESNTSPVSHQKGNQVSSRAILIQSTSMDLGTVVTNRAGLNYAHSRNQDAWI